MLFNLNYQLECKSRIGDYSDCELPHWILRVFDVKLITIYNNVSRKYKH